MESKANLINLEVLRMARDLVVNEYVDHRAQLHNQWLKEAEVAYSKGGYSVPYPDIPPYPTEDLVVKRAQVLLNFLLENKEKIAATELQDTSIGHVIEPEPEPVHVIDPEVETCTGPTGVLTDVIEPVNDTCTGPTGVASESKNLKSEDKIKDPGPIEDIFKTKKKNRIPMPPDEYRDYIKLKVDNKHSDDGNILVSDLVRSLTRPKVV